MKWVRRLDSRLRRCVYNRSVGCVVAKTDLIFSDTRFVVDGCRSRSSLGTCIPSSVGLIN